VDRQLRRAVFLLRRRTHRQAGGLLAADAVPADAKAGARRAVAQVGADAQLVESEDGVRRQVDIGPDPVEGPRLFEDLHVVTSLMQRDGGAKTADATPAYAD